MPTKIEWVTNADGTRGETWNPVVGCTKCAPGCARCYAERMAKRLKAMGVPQYQGVVDDGGWTSRVECVEKELTKPLRWKKPRMIFVPSMGDLFHPDVPFEFIDKVFAVMALCQRHCFQVLTKRPAIAAAYTNDNERPYLIAHSAETIDMGTVLLRRFDGHLGDVPPVDWLLSSVWLGTSISTQEDADRNIPHLLRCRAAVLSLSIEPLISPVDLAKYKGQISLCIVGGESCPGARPMHPDWVRSVRDQCVEAGVPFFFKQWGEWAPLEGSGAREPTPIGYWTEDASPDANVIHRAGDAEFISGLTTERVPHMVRVGKKRAGRILDGRTWDQMPKGT